MPHAYKTSITQNQQIIAAQLLTHNKPSYSHTTMPLCLRHTSTQHYFLIGGKEPCKKPKSSKRGV